MNVKALVPLAWSFWGILLVALLAGTVMTARETRRSPEVGDGLGLLVITLLYLVLMGTGGLLYYFTQSHSQGGILLMTVVFAYVVIMLIAQPFGNAYRQWSFGRGQARVGAFRDSVLKSPRGREPLRSAMSSHDHQVALAVASHAPDLLDEAARAVLIVRALEQATVYGGLSQARDQVEEFHPAPVIEALLHGAVRRDGEVAVHFAAMLMFVHGQAETAFDIDQRPFFLTFNTQDPTARAAAFRQLCGKIGVDAQRYFKPGSSASSPTRRPGPRRRCLGGVSCQPSVTQELAQKDAACCDRLRCWTLPQTRVSRQQLETLVCPSHVSGGRP